MKTQGHRPHLVPTPLPKWVPRPPPQRAKFVSAHAPAWLASGAFGRRCGPQVPKRWPACQASRAPAGSCPHTGLPPAQAAPHQQVSPANPSQRPFGAGKGVGRDHVRACKGQERGLRGACRGARSDWRGGTMAQRHMLGGIEPTAPRLVGGNSCMPRAACTRPRPARLQR